jgi:hypothetical protein
MRKLKIEQLTAIQRIFALSKANGADYGDDDLGPVRWEWPDSWLQKRLERVRREREMMGKRDLAKHAERF